MMIRSGPSSVTTSASRSEIARHLLDCGNAALVTPGRPHVDLLGSLSPGSRGEDLGPGQRLDTAPVPAPAKRPVGSIVWCPSSPATP